MKKKKLWKDIKKCFSHTKGRFISIFTLMMLGSFALVGLKVTGPNIRETGIHYFQNLNLSDITIIGDYGIDEENQKVINQLSDTEEIEYGYLKDVTVKESTDGIRIFSIPNNISKYELTDGRNAENESEIVLSNTYANQYQLGDNIEFIEKEDISGKKVLKRHSFKIVGFAKSPEFLSSINMGQSTSGAGELKGYAFVKNTVFDSDYYMLTRITFKDTKNIDPYSDEYTEIIQKHKNELEQLFINQPEIRLQTIKNEYQRQIDNGQNQIDEAKQKLIDTQNLLTNANAQIKEAQTSIDSSDMQLQDAKKQLVSGQSQLNKKWLQIQSAKQELESAKETLQETQSQLDTAYQQILQGRENIQTASSEIAKKEAELMQAKDTLAFNEDNLNQKIVELNEKQQKYDLANTDFLNQKEEYENAQEELQSQQAKLDLAKQDLINKKSDYETTISSYLQTIDSLKLQLENPNLSLEEKEKLSQELKKVETKLQKLESEYQIFIADTYTPQMSNIEVVQQQLTQKSNELESIKITLDEKEQELNVFKQTLDNAKQEINIASEQLKSAKQQLLENEEKLNQSKQILLSQKEFLEQKEIQYNTGYSKYQEGVLAYNQGLNTYNTGLSIWTDTSKTLSSKEKEYEENLVKLETAKNELAKKESEYKSGLNEFNEKKKEAETKISENEEKLDDVKESMNRLELPVYALDTRREVPGSEGYKIYDTISTIIDSLANIFPIFLYLVAALVTLTTMTRFVDEERVNSGTLKALGYTDRDIMKKFTVYGLIAGLFGASTGIALGHILIPKIVYNAYGISFDIPQIELHFYWETTVIALILALLSAVVPACIVAFKELKEKPSALLLPKPPANGSKIFLERIKPIWNKMSFTHKVTARNIFRYKKRMFMTIFGVCGSVTLLFAGFSVQNSISNINEKQFGEIIKYDLIVAQNQNLTDKKQSDINTLLNDNAIKQQLPIYYDSVTKVAGKNHDKQEIKLLVTEDEESFNDYITLQHRKTQEKINLKNKDGAIVSERLAKLLDVEIGDSFTILDSNNRKHTLKVADITEMYTGHFIFMNDSYYEKSFSKEYTPNANLITLQDGSTENARIQASKFMELEGVKGVVQNMTLTNQIDTIVHSLNLVMEVLIIVAILLAVVILYNLTNINIAERIRELSTIKVLGFYDLEVVMYIYRETILLSLLGILAGFGLGGILYRYILAVVPPDEVMFNTALGIKAFVVPVILMAGITIILGYMMNRKLKKLDMLSALKSVD